MSSAPALVIVGTEHDAELSTALRAASDPTGGLLYCDVTKLHSSSARFETELFGALGKKDSRKGFDQSREERRRSLHAWLMGECIDTLVIGHAHGLGADAWKSVVALAKAAGLRLWLALGDTTLRRGQREVVTALQLETVPAGELFDELRRRAPAVSEPEAEPFPPVPFEEFPTFLDACLRLLAPAEYERVAARYREARDQVAAALPSTCPIVPDEAAAVLRSLTDHCNSAFEALVVVRAAGAVLFLRDVFLSTEVQCFFGVKGSGRSDADGEAAMLLRSYRRPRRACLGALALLLASRHQGRLAEIVVGQVAADGSELEFGGEKVAVPSPFQGIIRAQLYLRLEQGATARDPLLSPFKGQDANRRISSEKLGWELRQISEETGIRFGDAPGTNRDESPQRWLRRVGIDMRPLPRRAPVPGPQHA